MEGAYGVVAVDAVDDDHALVTALNPHIGYGGHRHRQRGRSVVGAVAELVLEEGLLPTETLADLLRPKAVAGSGQVLA